MQSRNIRADALSAWLKYRSAVVSGQSAEAAALLFAQIVGSPVIDGVTADRWFYRKLCESGLSQIVAGQIAAVVARELSHE